MNDLSPPRPQPAVESATPAVTTPAAMSPPAIALFAGVGCYLIWGFVAEYFQLLIDRGISADLLLAHRVVWSTAFCSVVALFTLGRRPLLALSNMRIQWGRLAISAVLIAANWLAFIYAIQTNQRTDAALGYFINPVVSVALAVFLVHEKLGPLKWFCVALATAGVAQIVIASGGRVPWIAATLALSFAFYGYVRKFTAIDAILGLTIETAILLPVAAGYIAWKQAVHPIVVAPSTYALLALAGVVTAIPLVMFSYAARQLPLGTLGFLQYLAPMCQLLVAVFWRHERIGGRLPGFVCIWVALAIYTLAGLRARRVR